MEQKVIALFKEELTRLKKLLSPSYPACSEREVKDDEEQNSVKEAVLKVTLHVLRSMNLNNLADTLQNSKCAHQNRSCTSSYTTDEP